MNFNGRGIPTHCRCGERVGLFTSKTVKNLGRLFHSCPNGDEWADGSALEEIKDMKMKICDLERVSKSLVKDNESFNSELEVLIMDTCSCESAVTGLKSVVTGLEKKLQNSKMEVKGIKNMIVCVVVLVLFCKFVM